MPNRTLFQPPDGGYGWIIVVASVLITSCITPLIQCFGLIYEHPFKEMGITATQISFMLHLYNSIMCTLCFIAGPLLKKYNFKQVALIGCLIACSGVSITIFSKTYKQLLLSFCVLLGIGQGLITPAIALALNTYFKKRLTLAMSYSVTGTGLLPIMMPQAINFFLNNYGTQGTVLILAGVAFHAFIGALLLRPIKQKIRIACREEDHRQGMQNQTQHLENQESGEVQSLIRSDKNLTRLKKLHKLLNLELFKERTFVILIIGMAISYVAELNFNLINPFVLAELTQLNRSDVALAMSVQATGDILGRLFIPIISHKRKWPSRSMYLVTLIGSCTGRQVLVSCYNIRHIVISISFLLGLSKGARAVYQSLVLPEYVNVERLPVAMGFLMILNGILSLAIGPLIGLVHDLTDSYGYALYAASTISMACVVLWCMEIFIMKITTKTVTLHVQQENI